MKVLLIDVNCKSGSTGKIVYDLYTQLIEDGHESAICYGRGRLINEPNIYKFSNDLEVYFHAFLTRLTGFTSYFSFFATKKLIKLIKEFQPDVVHLHDLHAYFVNIKPVINYLKKNNIKTIWTFHCEFMYTGKCGYAYECEKWKSECGECPHLKDYPSSLWLDFTKKMFNDKKRMFEGFNNLVITTPSKWLADRVKQSYLKDRKIVVVHNGIDTDNIFYPRKFDHLKVKHKITSEKIILAIAPDLMSDRKGGRYVLDLAKRMKKEDVKFILIGIKDLSEKFDDNVIALGRTENQQELAEYYSMANIFVLCSEKETFSLTCAEALGCGTPVVGFKSGAPETIFKEPYATFVTYGDLNTLQEAIMRKLELDNINKKCTEYAKKEFSKQKMYEQFYNLYERISSRN